MLDLTSRWRACALTRYGEREEEVQYRPVFLVPGGLLSSQLTTQTSGDPSYPHQQHPHVLIMAKLAEGSAVADLPHTLARAQ